VANQVVAGYLSQRGHLSDELREVNFCRVRLGELLQAFEAAEKEESRSKDTKADDPAASSTHPVGEGTGRILFPKGCKTLESAIEQFLAEVTAEDLHELDSSIQAMIHQQFTALVHVCLASASLLKNLETAMMQEAIGFVESRLTVTDVAEMFLAQYADEEQARNEIIAAFDEASPERIVASKGARSSPAKMCLLAVPPGPAGERFRKLAHQALPEEEIADAVSTDDIIFYREWPHLPLTDLEQFGPVGREAYLQMTSVEHFTPHTRIDISRWHAPGAVGREQHPSNR
jgi:hypothetical protein